MEAADFLPFVANVGFSVVVCWYLLAKAIPEMQARFSADLKAQRDDNKIILEDERQANARERQFTVTSMERMLEMMKKDEIDLLTRTAEDARATYALLRNIQEHIVKRAAS